MIKKISLPSGYHIRKLSKTFLDSFRYGESEIYIAEYRNEEIGRICFVDRGASTLITVLNVIPEHRCRGIGSCLVQTIAQLTNKPLYLSTYTAKDFYTRLGFTVESEQKIFGFTFGFVMVLKSPT
jgi:predicted N-acetyltransferase YhbS